MNIDLYEDEECMNFSKEEIIKYLVEPCMTYPDIEIRLSIQDEYESYLHHLAPQPEAIAVNFDGEAGDFSVIFWGFQTALFLLNQEFMFIDDKAKLHTVSSDTYHNVVYEGTLRDKTHEEILNIIFKLFTIIYGTKKIAIEEIIKSQEGFQYPKCTYNVVLYKNNYDDEIIIFENIKFLITNSTNSGLT
jgi:hypothetical protein